ADPAELDVLARAYAFKIIDLVPQRVRLTLDYDERLIDAGGFAAVVPEGTTLEEVLQRYLVLVWALRGRQPGSYLQLRELDLEVLGESLSVGTDSVIAILGELLDDQDWVGPYRHPSQFGRPRFGTIVPEAGILLCTGAGGALVFRPEHTDAEPDAAEEAEFKAAFGPLFEASHEPPIDSTQLNWLPPELAPPAPASRLEPPTATSAPEPATADDSSAPPPPRRSWLGRRDKNPDQP
ncbi:MAG: hypothetical protein JWL70_1463, partial [Acidimicrobiia bacterium]|nr:hypothetical protein [Acidimicrobiia bacterium]